MEEVVKHLGRISSFQKISRAIYDRQGSIAVYGFLAEQKFLHALYVARGLKRKVLFLTSGKKETTECRDFLERAGVKSVSVETEEIRFYHIEARDKSNEAENIGALCSILNNDYEIAVISGEELCRKYMPPKMLAESIFSIHLDKEYQREQLCDKLVSIGYTREYKVEGVGQFALRGGILDIFSPSDKNPYRIEFFDDEIDSIRSFDVLSQKSIENKSECVIYPVTMTLYPNEGSKVPSSDHDDVSMELECLKEKSYFDGMERYVDILYGKQVSSLLDYFREDTVVILSDANRIQEHIENYEEEFLDTFKTALEKGEALKEQGNLLWSKSIIEQSLDERVPILHSYLAKRLIYFKPKLLVQAETRESVSFYGRLNDFANEVKYLLKEGYQVYILDANESSYENIRKKLADNAILVQNMEEDDIVLKKGNFVFMSRMAMDKGFLFTDCKIAFYTGNDIFRSIKRKKRRTDKKQYKGKKIENFIQLQQGDYVVHETYGVGQFIEVEQREFDGIRKDYIKIGYYGGDSLYVPLEQMDKVQSFIGNGAVQAYHLSKLGSSEWKKSKARTKKEVEEIAQDLVELYAVREKEQGYSFQKDTVWQREFEQEFVFEETEDQLKAIEEVKQDMESVKVMDRLLCGDVGYGKTEVAIRAIFKACMDGKQVVFLVPTTILAQQHYINIKERFEHYPIKVHLVSRFRSTKEVNDTFKGIEKGTVDVVIGTHKILSDKIKYQNLGLIVVDEEQRFGVKQKEALKKLRTNVDCLMLSATPIPRTLHLSLSGIRDMSILNEPPEERRPVITYVTEAKSSIIADAIEREVSRGGQVFFVYNRVETIDKIHAMLRELLPDVEIAVAHGQMTPRRLEGIMVDFLNKEFDVLLCTTIIETGMDISNANTMIVYDADKMGLSQLYQLRGRVGRSARQAYTYFMYEKDKVLTEIAEKRLKTVKEFTEFGSGFKVAMKDLEIRGAGSLLGEKQSGHIANVGYELYVKMLDEAIKKYKGELPVQEIETEIQIPFNGYIPQYYIEDEMEKIDVYKKISGIESKQDYEDMMDELSDRFSEIPQAVMMLLHVAYLRALGKKGRVTKIYEKNKVVYFVGTDNKVITKKVFVEQDGNKLVKNIIRFLEKVV